MEEIPQIEIRSLSIPEIPSYILEPSRSIPTASPVTVQLGFPIVNLPGCVQSNKEKNPKNTSLLKDDPKGTLTLCDGSTPSFDPIEFTPEDYLQTPTASIPPYKPPIDTQLPINIIPNIPKPELEKESTENKEVILEQEKIDIMEYIPPLESVVSTAVIATAAATSALVARPLANLILKLTKPITKKVITKISSKFRKVEILSVEERRELQREKTEALREFQKLTRRR